MTSKLQRALYGAVALCLGVWTEGALAATAYAPASGTVYCPYATPSGYLDISTTCNEWNHRGMILGSVYYRYTGGCASACTGGTSCNGGAGNYYVVTGANGWDFRQLFINANANSYSKTCDRCALGLVGASGGATRSLARSENRQYGTRTSAWMSPSLACGQAAPTTVGYPTL